MTNFRYSNYKTFLVDFATFPVMSIIFLSFTQEIGPILSFFAFVLISARYFPSISILQNISFAALFPIALTPFYLVLRGLFTHTNLSQFDLVIYLTILLGLLILVNAKNKIKHQIYLIKNIKKIIAAGSSLLILVFLTLFLKIQSLGHSLAWIMSGDSRGHLVFANDIAKSGWLDPSTFLLQPISAPSFLSMFINQASLREENIALVLSSQLQTYSYIWILFIGLLGILSAACAELIWKMEKKDNEEIPLWVIFLASCSSLFSAILGPATYDGFFTAVLSMATILALVNWIIEFNLISKLSIRYSFYGILIFVGSLLSWMFVAVFTFPLLLVGFWAYIYRNTKNKFTISMLAALGFFILALLLHSSAFVQNLIHQSKVALSVSGAITATKPNFYYGLIFGILLAGFVIAFTNKFLSKSFLIIAIVNVTALIAFKLYSNLGLLGWNYYLLKYQWILASVMLMLLVSFAYVQIAKLLFSVNRKSKILNSALIVSSCFMCFVLLSEIANPSKNLWVKALKGWENPRSSVVDQVLSTDFNSENPTLFFHHGYDGDSRLANFWLTSFLSQQEPIRGWNYTIDTLGDVKQMCEVNAYYNKVNIVTYDEELPALLFKACPNEEFLVTIETEAK